MPYVHAYIHANKQDFKHALKVKKQTIKDTYVWRILRKEKKKKKKDFYIESHIFSKERKGSSYHYNDKNVAQADSMRRGKNLSLSDFENQRWSFHTKSNRQLWSS